MIDKDYLSLTLIGEARNQPIEGIIGVANVIRNRAQASKHNYEDICLARGQFSCWNFGDPNYGLLQKLTNDIDHGNLIVDPYLLQCIAISEMIYANRIMDNTHGCKNYVTVDRYNLAKNRRAQEDEWILKMTPTITLGSHVFLK
jgi:N-acetylmuramoyl-L-alanine amidase